MKTVSGRHERADDECYIRNYENWNAWPMCPVKRYIRNRMSCAYLYADQDTVDAMKEGRVRVRAGNMFMPKEDDQILTYDSFEAFFNDGWEVD